MDQVKKNAYWIAMGVLALAALVFWGVAVAAGLNAKIDKNSRTLKSQVDSLKKFANIDDKNVANPDPEVGLPVDNAVKYWDERRKALTEEKEEILKKYRARDKRFEELFGGGAPGKIEYTNWVTEFRKRMQSDLRGQFKELLEVDDEATFNKAFPIKEPEAGDDVKLVIAQKQFYMAQAVAAAVKATGQKRATIAEMQFSSREPDPKAKNPVERHEVVVDLRFPVTQTAQLVSKLLQSWVVFEVRELKVEAAPFSLPQFEVFKLFEQKASMTNQPSGMKGFDRDVYVGTKDQSNPRTAVTPTLDEPCVGLKITLEALDFQLPEPAAATQK